MWLLLQIRCKSPDIPYTGDSETANRGNHWCAKSVCTKKTLSKIIKTNLTFHFMSSKKGKHVPCQRLVPHRPALLSDVSPLPSRKEQTARQKPANLRLWRFTMAFLCPKMAGGSCWFSLKPLGNEVNNWVKPWFLRINWGFHVLHPIRGNLRCSSHLDFLNKLCQLYCISR